MKKTLFTCMLLIAMIFSFVSCSDNNDETPQDPDNSGTTQEPGDDHVCEFGEWITTVESTCTEEGVEERSCLCGKKESNIINATGHNFGEWETIENATIISEGLKERICQCGEKETQSIPVLLLSDGLEFALNDDEASYSVTGIGACTDTDLVIPSTYNDLPVTIIGEGAFGYCRSLNSVLIPDSVTIICNDAFRTCTSLTSVTIGDGVTSIGESAFAVCTSLTNLTIGDNVTSIGLEAFSCCSSLVSITIPDGVASIDDEAFTECDSLTSINVSENNEYYKSIDGNLYNKDVTTLIQYATGKADTSFTILDGVTSIGKNALNGCRSLVSITIPDSVTSIGDYGIAKCTALTSIVFNGTTAQWKAVRKGMNWNSNTRNYTVYCTNGEIVD